MFRQLTFRKAGLWLALALIIPAAVTVHLAQRSHAAAHQQQPLTFEARVAAQRALEEVYSPAAPLAHGQARSRNRRSTTC